MTVNRRSADPMLDISMRMVGGVTHVNKFGHAEDGVQTTATDIWDRADATPAQQIWIPPTQARAHTIASSSSADDYPSGTGARTVRVYGLANWAAKETYQDILMDGAGDNAQPTSQFVIIHRMKVMAPTGSGGTNAGTITATAAEDGTITAQINIGHGQTDMAIYGIPSIQDAYMTGYYAEIHKAQGAAAAIDCEIHVNPAPDQELATFIHKHHLGAQSTGSGYIRHPFEPYFEVQGPAIIKIQATANTADVSGSAGFDLILVDAPYCC